MTGGEEGACTRGVTGGEEGACTRAVQYIYVQSYKQNNSEH